MYTTNSLASETQAEIVPLKQNYLGKAKEFYSTIVSGEWMLTKQKAISDKSDKNYDSNAWLIKCDSH